MTEREKKLDAQRKYCEENNYPHFMPRNGFCWDCKGDLTEGKEVWYFQSLVTGCHLCCRSYCD